MSRRLYVLLLVLFILAPITDIVLVRGAGTGYLAIKDYLGTVWTIDDVEKIINTTINANEGPKSLADYFWIVVDDNSENKYNLRNFTASPLDGKTAVLPLPAGDHYVDIYWFGYHQRQLVHIVAGEVYTLNLNTAPVVPFKTAEEPPTSAEWDLVSNPNGLTIQRRDGKAYVRFVYNQSYIEVAWYDPNTGWNYQDLDVYIDTNYQYRFHITDPSNPTYTEEGTGSFLWLSWNTYKIVEEVKWNKTGEILHVVYSVVINENQKLFDAVNEFFNGVGGTIVNSLMMKWLVDPVTYTVTNIKGMVDLVQGSYDAFIGTAISSKYQSTVLLIWDVFVTPTQIIVLAHTYNVDQNGHVTPKPITSANAFTIDNRLVYIKQLSGGVVYYSYYGEEIGFVDTAIETNYQYELLWVNGDRYYSKVEYEPTYGQNRYYIYMPFNYVFSVDDLSKYNIMFWFMTHMYVSVTYTYSGTTYVDINFTIYLELTFNDTADADYFAEQLNNNNIEYYRNGNSFTITLYSLYKSGSSSSKSEVVILDQDIIVIGDDQINSILKYARGPGTIRLKVDGGVDPNNNAYVNRETVTIKNNHILIGILPKMTPPQISLLKDGYQTVNGAVAVQVYSSVFRTDKTAYMLGYYLLGNDPPPVYIINDTHYDPIQDVMYYCKTIITVDAYGQDIVDITANTTFNANNETIHNYYLSIKKTVRLINGVTIALFDYNKMAFLNLAPEVIKYLLMLPPSQGGYGTPIIDWSTVSTVTINMSRPYQLYYYDKGADQWIQVWADYDSSSITYYIKRTSDNITIETLPNGNMSKYYYKLIYTDTNQTLHGWLHNRNGTLELITGSVTWSLTPQELQLLLQQAQLQGIFDQWQEQWNNAAQQLGLIPQGLQNMVNAINNGWNWLNRNWLWLLGGLFLFLILIILLASTGRPRVTVSMGGYYRGRRRRYVLFSPFIFQSVR